MDWLQSRFHNSLPSWIYFLFVFQDQVSLCPGQPPHYLGTYFVDHPGIELAEIFLSASCVFGLKACATTTLLDLFLGKHCFQHLLIYFKGLKIFFVYYLHFCFLLWVCACHDKHMGVRGQLAGLLSSCGVWGLNSGYQA